MSTNFPNQLDSLSNPNATDSLNGHAAQHANANDAIEALQAKIGIDGSEDPNSIDYKVYTLESQVQSIGNNADTTLTLLGLEGNNDLVVTGIENKTTIDSFSKSIFRTVRYSVQISKGSEHVSEVLDLVQDGTDVYLQQYEIASNTTNNLATINFEENSGIISLTVTPISGSVSVRYYRTALKI